MLGFDENFFKYISQVKKIKTQELSELNYIEYIHQEFREQDDYEELMTKTLNSLLSKNENSYVMTRPISSYAWEKIDGLDEFKKLFPAEGQPEYGIRKIENGYELTLPPLISKQYAKKTNVDGKAIQATIRYLIKQYEGEHGEIIPFAKATLIFTHHVAENKLGYAIPDPDNLDIKSCIDALQGRFIECDNLMSISLIQRGEISSQSYTVLTLKDGLF